MVKLIVLLILVKLAFVAWLLSRDPAWKGDNGG